VGRLYAVKNYGLLLDAAARLVRRADGLHFVIVGDGPERAAIEGTVRDRLMADRVHVLGERADVPRILAGSDMFVLTSHSEGLSIAILEAMASGLAVVATDVGDNRHLIADEEQGFLVAPGDGDALAERILTLCSDPEQMRRMGASARGKAQSRFEHARMLEDYSRVYDEAIRGV
jgi:glycosyltransferase involved in cell wall biosynthesis